MDYSKVDVLKPAVAGRFILRKRCYTVEIDRYLTKQLLIPAISRYLLCLLHMQVSISGCRFFKHASSQMPDNHSVSCNCPKGTEEQVLVRPMKRLWSHSGDTELAALLEEGPPSTLKSNPLWVNIPSSEFLVQVVFLMRGCFSIDEPD